MNEIHVKIAEVKIGREGEILKATLGSCVGIAFIWQEKGICGLAHCFLPESIPEENIIGAKYVNQAIMSLIKLMDIKKKDMRKIKVYVAGGGKMMKNLLKHNHSQVGQHNAESALKHLDAHGFIITEAVTGSQSGSKIIVNCTTGEVEFIQLEELNFYMWKV